MDFLKGLFGMSGGKRKTHRNRKAKRGGAAGAACESGEACAAQFSADSSLSQGETFAKMTAAYHGGKRTRAHRRNRKMRGGAADITQAFEPMPAELHKLAGTDVLDQKFAELSKFAPQTGGSRSSSRSSQRGGSALLTDAFQAPSAELHKESGTSVLDQAFAQLKQFIPNHNGGGRKSRKTHRKTHRKTGGGLGSSPVDAPAMLLRPEDYDAAYLNPQWVQENVVNPNFNAPASAYIAATSGGSRRSKRSRSSYRNKRKAANGKSRKSHRKSHRKAASRKSSRKH